MRNGRCPKCDGMEVHEVAKTAVEVAIALSWMSTADLSYYVCSKCGYVELYVKDTSLLPKIAEKYPRVRIKNL